MKEELLHELIEAYESADEKFHATAYWSAYKKSVTDAAANLDPKEFRSGQHPILRTFGFNEQVFTQLPLRDRVRVWLSQSRRLFAQKKGTSPYSIDLSDIRELAYHHCEVVGEASNAIPIKEIHNAQVGSPDDSFEIEGRHYTMQFLGFYLRYCFVHRNAPLKGNEVIVELGSGSGHQVELLKRAYPDLTILCYDLPAQLYVCEQYLTAALGADQVVSASKTLKWDELSGIEKGKVHFFGNWQMPLNVGFDIDWFWNAASFGEMEPHVVQNYLSYVMPSAKHIYLLQARHGKEEYRVEKPILFEDYNSWLKDFDLVAEADAWRAHKRLTESGGYFEAVWKRK